MSNIYSLSEVLTQIKEGEEFKSTCQSCPIDKITKKGYIVKFTFKDDYTKVASLANLNINTCEDNFTKLPPKISLMEALKLDSFVTIDEDTRSCILRSKICCDEKEIVDGYNAVLNNTPIAATMVMLLINWKFSGSTSYKIIDKCKCTQVKYFDI